MEEAVSLLAEAARLGVGDGVCFVFSSVWLCRLVTADVSLITQVCLCFGRIELVFH